MPRKRRASGPGAAPAGVASGASTRPSVTPIFRCASPTIRCRLGAMTTTRRGRPHRPAPPPLDLTRDLALVSDLVAAANDPVDDLLRRGLDALQRVVPYDLATAFLLDGGKLVARVARGRLAGPEVKEHVLSLEDAAPLREALESRRARAFLETDHAQDGD